MVNSLRVTGLRYYNDAGDMVAGWSTVESAQKSTFREQCEEHPRCLGDSLHAFLRALNDESRAKYEPGFILHLESAWGDDGSLILDGYLQLPAGEKRAEAERLLIRNRFVGTEE